MKRLSRTQFVLRIDAALAGILGAVVWNVAIVDARFVGPTALAMAGFWLLCATAVHASMGLTTEF